MTVKSLLFFALLSYTMMTNATTPGKCSIKGQLEGLEDDTKLLLLPGNTHKDEKPMAEAFVKNGKFEFPALDSKGARMYWLKLEKANGIFSIVIDNEDVFVTGKAVITNQGNNAYFQLMDPIVQNGKTHALYLEKRKPYLKLDSLYKAFHDNNNIVFAAYSKARVDLDTTAQKTIEQTAEWKKFASDESNFFQTVKNTINGIIMDNKETWWGPFMMLNTISYFTPEQKPLFDAFSEEAKNSYYGKLVKEELFPEGFIGKVAPAFTVTDASNKSIASTELYKGKKYILIDFWASWCAPCRKEIPNLKNLHAKYAAKGLEIISISLDKVDADWQKALKFEQLPWPNFKDNNGIANLYKVKTIPSMFLLDGTGKIIGENLRGEALAAKLEELFQ